MTPAERLNRFGTLCRQGANTTMLRNDLLFLIQLYMDQDWRCGKAGSFVWPSIAWALIIRLTHSDRKAAKLSSQVRALKAELRLAQSRVVVVDSQEQSAGEAKQPKP